MPVLIVLILLAAGSRLIPHMYNFSPLGAICLFGAAYFTKKWQAYLIPLAATFLSDLYINNVVYAQYNEIFTLAYQGFYWQYASYLLIIALAQPMLKKPKPLRVMAGGLMATLVFFLVSNFGSWVGNPAYARSLQGLINCYAAGIPFVKGTLLGNLTYSALLFGSFEALKTAVPQLKLAKDYR